MGRRLTFYGRDLARTHDAGFGFWARGATPGIVRRLRGAGIESGLVVDLGCGSGIAARLLADAGYDVLGIDVSEEMVALARERAPEARFVAGSLHEAGLPRCAAVVAMGEILSYAEITPALLARVREALVPGGLFLFDVATPGRGGAAPQRSWSSGDGWVVCMEASEADRLLTRTIVSFRDLGGGEWRRSDERHRLVLYEPAAVVAGLREAGFAEAAMLAEGYGPELELPEGIAVIEGR